MAGRQLVDRELVVHAFALVDGPGGAAGQDQLARLWLDCQQKLGMTAPIVGSGLPIDIPVGWVDGLETVALAALERPGADYQAILRRESGVLNLSVVFASPQDDAGAARRRRLRVGSARAPGWVEFDRWWDELVTAGVGDLLGLARIYQAKLPDDQVDEPDVTELIRLSLPTMEQDEGWHRSRTPIADSLSLWELSPRVETQVERRFVTIAPQHRDPELSALTWSRGDTAMPPLARYLMHGAKLRYQFRVWTGERRQIDWLRQRLSDGATRLGELIRAPGDGADGASSERARSQVEVGDAVLTAARLREMRHAVQTTAENMSRIAGSQRMLALPGVGMVTDDQEFARWFRQELDDVLTAVESGRRTVEKLARTATEHAPGPLPAGSGATLRTAGVRPSSAETGATRIRMGFSADIVAYSVRSAPGKTDAQRRLSRLVVDVLRDLRLELEECDHQEAGDAITVFLPAEVEVHRALARVLRSTAELLTIDNARHTDPIRLRLGMALGPIGVAALGFGNNTIVECSRLRDCEPLRQAMDQRHDLQLAALISAGLYDVTVAEGYPRLDPATFRPVDVRLKEYRKRGWLWPAL